jgi:hypothetical protein
MTEQWERDLGRLIWDAKTSNDATAIIEECIKRFRARTIPIGRPNNSGTINMAADSGLALIERLTNGIDGLIELAVLLNPGAIQPSSPEEAARLLFDIPAGGHGDLTETERREIAKGLVIGMHESGVKKRPTIRVTDTGVGQHPSVFSKTLLSLNEDNKANIGYTMGTFGQGGSATLSFSNYTVFCSRRHPELLGPGEADRVGFTVAYEEDTDPDTTSMPWYVWLVKEDGSPLDLPVDAFPDLEYGTRISHVEYDVQGLVGQFTTQMWQFLNNGLFDPVLPFILEGDRTAPEVKAGSRVMLGNAARLSRVDRARGDIEIAAEDTHEITLKGYGSVTASWWVLARPAGSTSKSGPAESYASAGDAVVMTLHGQRQATKPRTWLKDTTKLPFLYKDMIVCINTNGLNGAGRRELYTSTRERERKSDLSAQIFSDVADLIREDVDLKRLNHLARERRLAQAATAANEKIQKRLGKFVKTKLKERFKSGSSGKGTSGAGQAGGTGNQPGDRRGKNKRSGGNTKGRDTDDSHLPNVPTSLAFDTKALRVAQGFSTTMWVQIDAKNGYLPEHDDDLDIRISGTGEHLPFVKSRSKLLGGQSLWKIAAPAECPTGTYQLSATLMTSNGQLNETIALEVFQPPEPKKTGKGGREEETGPEIKWIEKAKWEYHEGRSGPYTARTVGHVDESAENTTVWVNRNFHTLDDALGKRGLSEDAIVIRADRYLYPVACGLWLQHFECQNLTNGDQPTDEYLDGEMARLAEAVIVAIDPDVDIADAEAED